MPTVKVTPAKVQAANLRLLVDEKLGRESDEAVKAIANARRRPRRDSKCEAS